MHRLLPRPALSAVIFLLWAALSNAATLGTVLLGALLALALPFVTRPFWSDAPRLAHPGKLFILALRVAIDIVLANLSVARRVIGPLNHLKPAFIEVPLDLRDPFVATILSSVVSLTPGTVSIDVDQERWVLLIHALDAPDSDALIAEIKQRYEAPLKEIFAC
ncbi:MAG: Na+/H+ antiporter subunit E [Gallionella sp.]|nr:Na+/H+ antiporter subunit E [Gallionella sp.]MDP1941852.1 Na+/H+ antiporter subunit E [Gallionella sp.]